MQAEPSPSWRGAFAPNNSPHCVFVTGPRGAGKTRWVQLRIRDLAEKQPGTRCAVLLTEEGRMRMEGFAHDAPGVAVRRLFVPCICCPSLADLPGTLRALVAEVCPDWLFVEVAALAAAGQLAEFDRACGWPREVVVCLDRAWTTARCEHALSPFQMVMLELADLVVPNPAAQGIARYPDQPTDTLVLT
jgi:G3E family GTPase